MDRKYPYRKVRARAVYPRCRCLGRFWVLGWARTGWLTRQ